MIITEKLVYEGPDGLYEGYVSYDDSISSPQPGVLISHAFMGQGQFDIDKSIALAKLGYVGFAIDMYGQGQRAKTADEASQLLNALNNDRPLLSERINRALIVLKDMEQVNYNKTGAIGFCLGGKCVLDLARSGAEVNGVVSFHGILDDPKIHDDQEIKASILVCHGWNDPLATAPQVVDFSKEMTDKNADWQLLAFGHTGHSFTNPAAQRKAEGFFYDHKAHVRSWHAMVSFFEEKFR
jgi:dienelactone hydrolase